MVNTLLHIYSVIHPGYTNKEHHINLTKLFNKYPAFETKTAILENCVKMIHLDRKIYGIMHQNLSDMQTDAAAEIAKQIVITPNPQLVFSDFA